MCLFYLNYHSSRNDWQPCQITIWADCCERNPTTAQCIVWARRVDLHPSSCRIDGDQISQQPYFKDSRVRQRHTGVIRAGADQRSFLNPRINSSVCSRCPPIRTGRTVGYRRRRNGGWGYDRRLYLCHRTNRLRGERRHLRRRRLRQIAENDNGDQDDDGGNMHHRLIDLNTLPTRSAGLSSLEQCALRWLTVRGLRVTDWSLLRSGGSGNLILAHGHVSKRRSVAEWCCDRLRIAFLPRVDRNRVCHV